MTRCFAATALAVLLAACGGTDNDPQIEFLPKSLDLAPASWADNQTAWGSIGILNQTWFPVELSGVELVGTGAAFLELEVASVPLEIPVNESAAVRVRVKPARLADAGRWSSASYEASLRFNIGGSGTVGATDEAGTGAGVVQAYEVPISLELVCDLDGDGYDDKSCSGGADCNDRLEAVNPEADEACDGFDNNCDGRVDVGCD